MSCLKALVFAISVVNLVSCSLVYSRQFPSRTVRIVISYPQGARPYMAMGDVQKELLGQGAEPIVDSAAQFGQILKEELVKWVRDVRSSGA